MGSDPEIKRSFTEDVPKIGDLSLHLLDLVQNALKAHAKTVRIRLLEQGNLLSLSVSDDGDGMNEETLSRAGKVRFFEEGTGGFGLWLFRQAAVETGGDLKITSVESRSADRCHGTRVIGVFHKDHPAMKPLGDMTETVAALIAGAPDRDFLFSHERDGRCIAMLDTRELRKELGPTVPLNSPMVLRRIRNEICYPSNE